MVFPWNGRNGAGANSPNGESMVSVPTGPSGRQNCSADSRKWLVRRGTARRRAIREAALSGRYVSRLVRRQLFANRAENGGLRSGVQALSGGQIGRASCRE